jgi:type II secretory pathway pseudopilin PulG
MKSLLIFWWKLTRQSNRSRLDSSEGITMIELLVGVIMAFLILTPLLSFVVNILDTEKQEQAKTKIEQDVQNAADYITKDLEKAVFIYDAAGIANGTSVRTALNGAGEPILVFWRRELKQNTIPVLDKSGTGYSNCKANPTSCDDTYVFSLVAYYLDNTLAANSPWSKQARIVRYSMNDCVKDPTDGTKCITTNTTFSSLVKTDVVKKDDGFQSFSLALTGANITAKMNLWPQQADGSKPTPKFARNNVLVDYIDNGAAKTSPTCNIGSLIPSTEQKGFYACVSTDESGKSIAQVVIRGNVLAYLDKNNNPSCPDASSPKCPQVSVQVQARGVLAQ